MSTVEIKLDDDLLALIDERAAASGKPRDEVIAEAVRRQLQGGQLRETLASARARSNLSEDEAMQLAVAEQKAYRAERAADVG
ncbi:MAG: ribbon-helix-helix protein, CopG family [Actinomycetota bacterium]|nr:ribbon-helix-helix protein, CopG family [Actinomycetota bacterium]